MKRRGILGAVLLAATFNVGCDKAKGALKDALGIEPLKADDPAIAEVLTQVGWKAEDPRFANFKIIGGFKVGEKFSGDLGQTVEIPVPGADKAEGQGGKLPSVAMLKVTTIPALAEGQTEQKRFQIVSVGRVEGEGIKIDGNTVNQFMDEADRISKANQAKDGGFYVLVQAKSAEKGLAYLKGTTTVHLNTGTDTPVGGALVFTDGSPFVTKSGASGAYFLAILEGEKGTITAYKKGVADDTPNATSTQIPYAGILEQAPGYADVAAKADELPVGGAKAKELLSKANAMASDKAEALGFKGWTLIDAALVWTQPPAKPAVVPEPPAPATDTDNDTETETATATETETTTETATSTDTSEEEEDTDTETETDTSEDRLLTGDGVTRGVEGDPQRDLGCVGWDDNGGTLIYDTASYDDTSVRGWRFMGDVSIQYEHGSALFGDPEDLRDTSGAGSSYLDTVPGYCLLTTGNPQQEYYKSDLWAPGPAAKGQVSEMWQTVKIPAGAKAIQVRVAFFSQEFPKFVNTGFNDSFFIKFDESMDYIAKGNLNDIAGKDDPTTKANCGSAAKIPAAGPCGDWKPIVATDSPAAGAPPHGQLWSIEYSAQAQKKGSEYGAISAEQKAATGGQAYYGYVPAKIICKDLAADEVAGATRTLRFNVADAGDNLFDSALAVDGVTFLTQSCADAKGLNDRLGGESRADVL